MITLVQNHFAFTKTLKFIFILLLGYVTVAAPIARCKQTRSDTLIAVNVSGIFYTA
ncbi:MAG: hypothetical protein M0P61_12555 [Ignavibacteriaceae bacterium]|nr:hypothetical protein [Ignavibacteriaceae bacterium]